MSDIVERLRRINVKWQPGVHWGTQVEAFMDEGADEIERLRGALRSCEDALRDYPLQAFRTAEKQRARAAAIDLARDALAAYDEAKL